MKFLTTILFLATVSMNVNAADCSKLAGTYTKFNKPTDDSPFELPLEVKVEGNTYTFTEKDDRHVDTYIADGEVHNYPEPSAKQYTAICTKKGLELRHPDEDDTVMIFSKGKKGSLLLTVIQGTETDFCTNIFEFLP